MVITFESRKKSYPAYIFVISYAITALIFKDRWHYLIGLVMALTLFLGSCGLGKRLSFLIFKTADQSLYCPIGLGCILLINYFIFSFSTAPFVFYSIWGLLLVLAVFELPVLLYRLNRNYFYASPLILLAFWSSFTPSVYPTTLEYFLGMPYQYLAIGRITCIPYNLYSSLAPFGNVMAMLFTGVGVDSGIKAFSLILYFQIISISVALLRWVITEPVFAGGTGRDVDYQTDLLYMTRTELLVIPMLLFPGLFAFFHYQTYDLLTALFFSAAVASIVKEYDTITALKIWNIGLLLAFAAWTKSSVLIYVPWIGLLWFGLTRWRFSKENWKTPAILWTATLLFWIALPVRNAIYFDDPFYPALSGILSGSHWSPMQSLLFERTIMNGSGGLLDAFSRFAALVFHPEGVGIVILLSLLVYPFSRKVRVINQLIIFAIACFITWSFLFQDFRNFLPVYVLLFPVCYFAFRHLYIRSPSYMWVAWAVCIVTTAIPLFTFFSSTRLILPAQSQQKYLEDHLDYYRIAEGLEPQPPQEILMLGDHRVAYYKQRILTGSPFDVTPILPALQTSANPEDLYSRIRRQGIRYIVYREASFEEFYGPMGVFALTQMQMQNWRKMLQSYTNVRMKSGDVQLLELSHANF
jgi:hypothetical protein